MVEKHQIKKALLTLGSDAGKLLLEIAWGSLVFMTEGMSGPYVAGIGRENYNAMFRAQGNRQKRRALQRLKQQKFIRIQEQDEQILVVLTDGGKTAILREKIYSATDVLPRGQQCLVVFDFPISARNSRNAFRYFLKEVGFVRIQQSVWATERNVGLYLRSLIHFMGCEDWIRIYYAHP